MRILVCDDEEYFLNDLCIKMENILFEQNINVSIVKFRNGNDILSYYEREPDADILIMDILLGEENGYEIASKIRLKDSRIKIVFITSITKYALKGYEIGASRYLLKPISFQKLKAVLIKTIEEVRKSNAEYIIEKNDNGIYKIFMDDIVYIETSGRNTIIHTKNQDIVSYQSLKQRGSG